MRTKEDVCRKFLEDIWDSESKQTYYESGSIDFQGQKLNIKVEIV